MYTSLVCFVRTGDGLTSRLKTVYLVQGILFFALAGLETIGLYAAWTVSVWRVPLSLQRSVDSIFGQSLSRAAVGHSLELT